MIEIKAMQICIVFFICSAASMGEGSEYDA